MRNDESSSNLHKQVLNEHDELSNNFQEQVHEPVINNSEVFHFILFFLFVKKKNTNNNIL